MSYLLKKEKAFSRGWIPNPLSQQAFRLISICCRKGKDFFITSKSLSENYMANTLFTLWTVLMLMSQSGSCAEITQDSHKRCPALRVPGSLTPFSKTKQFYLLIDFLLKVFFLSNLIRIFVALYGTIALWGYRLHVQRTLAHTMLQSRSEPLRVNILPRLWRN